MTEVAVSRSEPSPYVQGWVESLAQVLAQISGSPLACVALDEAPAGLVAAGESDLWIVGACSGGLRGEMSLRLAADSTQHLARIFMSETAAPAGEATAEQREAAVELIRQAAGLVATSLKERWGDVQLRLDAAAGAPFWPASLSAWLRIGEDPATAALVEIHLSAALMAALRAEKTDLATPAANPAPAVGSAPASAPQLDLLLDVELAVTLRFGSRRLLLREVLDLNPGTVLELDRQVQDPVDVLLDGRIVARGEVVVLDGNYGLRVTEVAPAAGS